MNWALLVIAGLLEVGWAIGLKYTHGFTRLWPSVWTVVAMVVSIVLLGVAMRSLPAGTAYAVWTGIGTMGTVVSASCYSVSRPRRPAFSASRSSWSGSSGSSCYHPSEPATTRSKVPPKYAPDDPHPSARARPP